MIEDIDFNLPLHLKMIHRTNAVEFGSEMTLFWSLIDWIQEYPYLDDWKEFKGDKFYIKLRYDGREFLVYGSYTEMKTNLLAYAKWANNYEADED